MNGKKVLWVFVGLLFVGAIVVAAVLGSRGGGEAVAVVADAGAVPVAEAPAPAPPRPDAAPPPGMDAAPVIQPGGGTVPDASAADAAGAVDAGAVDAGSGTGTGTGTGTGGGADAGKEPGAGGEIEFEEPRVVGDADPGPVIAVLEKKETFESCRPKKEVAKVKVQFHVGLGGLRLAAPAADNQGDASVARCIANRVKSAKPTWKEDESGIIIVDATVPPKP